MSDGFARQFSDIGVTKVLFKPSTDGDFEDESTNPPLVRDRWTDQATLYLTADFTNQIDPNTNTSQWLVGGRNDRFFMNRVKKLSIVLLQTVLWTPNINDRNNTIEFETQNSPGVTWTAKIPCYNYTRMVADWYITNPASARWPLSCQYGIGVGYNGTVGNYGIATNSAVVNPDVTISGDPYNGLLTWLLTSLNRATTNNGLTPYSPISDGEFIAVPSIGYPRVASTQPIFTYPVLNSGGNVDDIAARYGFIQNTSGFRFTGGSFFRRGLHVLGINPIPTTNNFSDHWDYGPASFLYTRYIDVVSNALTQYTKLSNTGSSAPGNLVTRIYLDNPQYGIKSEILDAFRSPQINFRKDATLSNIDITLLDEYGEKYPVPEGPNSEGLQFELCTQL